MTEYYKLLATEVCEFLSSYEIFKIMMWRKVIKSRAYIVDNMLRRLVISLQEFRELIKGCIMI